MEVRPHQCELVPQASPEQSGRLPAKLAKVKLQRPAVVDEDGVGLGDLAVVMEVEAGDVIPVGHKAGVNVDWGLSGSSAFRIKLGPIFRACSDKENSGICWFKCRRSYRPVYVQFFVSRPLSPIFPELFRSMLSNFFSKCLKLFMFSFE